MSSNPIGSNLNSRLDGLFSHGDNTRPGASSFNAGGIGNRPVPSQHNANLQLPVDFVQDAFSRQFSHKAADQDAFHQMMRQAFSSDADSETPGTAVTYHYDKAEALRQKVLDGDLSWLPEVQVLSTSAFSKGQMNGGQSGTSGTLLGAFGDDTIMLNESVLSDPGLALRVYAEEAGHALDKALNQDVDSAGDEGALFSRLLMDDPLSAEQVQALKTENDQGILGGTKVEFFFGGIGSFFSGIGNSISSGFNSFTSGISNIGSSIAGGFNNAVNFVSDVFTPAAPVVTVTPLPPEPPIIATPIDVNGNAIGPPEILGGPADNGFGLPNTPDVEVDTSILNLGPLFSDSNPTVTDTPGLATSTSGSNDDSFFNALENASPTADELFPLSSLSATVGNILGTTHPTSTSPTGLDGGVSNAVANAFPTAGELFPSLSTTVGNILGTTHSTFTPPTGLDGGVSSAIENAFPTAGELFPSLSEIVNTTLNGNATSTPGTNGGLFSGSDLNGSFEDRISNLFGNTSNDTGHFFSEEATQAGLDAITPSSLRSTVMNTLTGQTPGNGVSSENNGHRLTLSAPDSNNDLRSIVNNTVANRADKNFVNGVGQAVIDAGVDTVATLELGYDLLTDPVMRENISNSIGKISEALQDPTRRAEVIELIGSALGEGLVDAVENFSDDPDYYAGYIAGSVASGAGAGKAIGALGKIPDVIKAMNRLDVDIKGVGPNGGNIDINNTNPGGIIGGKNVTDFPEVAAKISQKQNRHIGGRPEHAARGGGYLDSFDDAQAVLDAYKSGSGTIIGESSQGFPIVRVDGVKGTNVNVGAGIESQSTNVFMIKGTKSPSVVPVNPNWKPQ